MQHTFYFTGDSNEISWEIQTNRTKVTQSREHVDIYKNKVNSRQSKFIALHVGLFWAIGTFTIKNEDDVKIKLDDKTMYEQMTSKVESKDELIKNRIHFIKMLILQRKLKIQFELTQPNQNDEKDQNRG